MAGSKYHSWREESRSREYVERAEVDERLQRVLEALRQLDLDSEHDSGTLVCDEVDILYTEAPR